MCAASNSKSVAEKTFTAMVGGKVTLPCRTQVPTPVNWIYRSSANAHSITICSAGNIMNGYTERFVLDRDVPGDYSLIIRSVTREDAGLYICREDIGQGTEHRAILIVYGKISIFKVSYNCSESLLIKVYYCQK